MRRTHWRVASLSALCTVVALVFCVALVSCAQPSDSTRLVGTKWVLESLNAQPLLENTTITLEFGDGTAGYREGTFHGNSSCNSYGGTYTANDTQLEFTDVNTTDMGCDAAILAQEEAYARALGSAVTYSFEGKGLDLVNRDSGETLRFSRA